MATAIPFDDGGERLTGFLRSVPVLGELDERELRALAAIPTQWSFDQEERVFSEGEPGTTLYIVERGACGLEIGGHIVKSFEIGDVFGEVAVIDRRPRTATVRATQPATLLAFEADALARFEASEPAAALKLHKALARQLTGYVRQADTLYDRMDVLLVQDGGCAPGYDSVTAQLTRALEGVGRQVFVAREGFKSLVSGTARDFSCLIHDRALYERLEHVPGVIHSAPLAQGRGASFRTERFTEFHQAELQRLAADHIVARGVNVLIGIGGNGTFAGTNAVSKLLPDRVKTFFVPVTIDSDISGTECIGEHTGVMIGAEKIHGYIADAQTHHRVYIIEMMGAEGGYHALHSCLGAGADLALLPSSRYDPARVVAALARRRSAVIVVAEGYKRGERRAEGVSGNAAEYFHQELLHAGLDPKRKVVCEGFSRDVRGAAPNYRDITLAQRMARRLVALLLAGRTRVMPAITAAGESTIDFDDVRTDNSVESALAELANRLGA
jgi:6-phosphofructokinase 1